MAFVLLMVVAGLCVATQAPINAALARTTGPVAASFVSFTIGALTLLLLLLVVERTQLGRLGGIAGVPRWQLLGGILGAGFVSLIVVSVPRIGAAPALFASILGQVVCGIVLDHYGFFGLPVVRASPMRLAGAALMAVGLALVFRGR